MRQRINMRCLILPAAVKPSITMILNEDILSFSFLKFFIFLHKKFYAFERIALNEVAVFLRTLVIYGLILWEGYIIILRLMI